MLGVDVNDENDTAYEEAIKLNEGEVSEAAKRFVADVESVVFSDPELVWVRKVDSETTVGGIKEDRGLEVEYSADLTEEKIAEINAQTVEAGDWALISVLPFTSEETLTVTMKNGDQFVIKVTDAQLSTHVITVDGQDYNITVTYDDAAQIPEGAKLKVTEINEKDVHFADYLKRALVEIEGADAVETSDEMESNVESLPDVIPDDSEKAWTAK